jgi:hypothetical protein
MNTSIFLSGTAAKWSAVVLLTVLSLWLGHLTGKPLAGGPLRIVRLELAPTASAANEFLQAWAKARPCNWRMQLNESLSWDTWFICAYAPLFALLCWLAADHFIPAHPALAASGRGLAAAQLLAGTLDFIENAAMKHMINAGQADAPWPQISSTASGVKWLLIFAFMLFAIGTLIHRLLRGS